MILDDIIRNKRAEVEAAKRSYPPELISAQAGRIERPKDFFKAISPYGKVKIIAEIKRASPSKGILREDFNPVDIARSYGKGGASAISVLTDKKFFKGDLTYLRDVRNAVPVPLLRKDFIIDPYQVYEARLYGADAILLIAAVLDKKALTELLNLAHSLGMNAIVEVHDEKELESALMAGSRIIGINNRNLKTFDVSLEISRRLVKLIPKEKIVISESGITGSEDIKRLRDDGIYVFLIGETFMKALDLGRELCKLLVECNGEL
ncbi:MAG TPA: indole-3-glycerol phosphate synthase TrpC [Thermodesulfobacteriota bacterium]|nr:indole-3-glycerol phosphate synthase TrpC [Thermodesulfobacteriota bacterium]